MESVTRIKVRYAETDQMGVVHHSVYAVYLEAARVDFLERAGLPYHRVEARGVFFPVVELGLTFRAPARFGEVVEVRTRLAELSSRALLFRYRVEREGVLWPRASPATSARWGRGRPASRRTSTGP